MKQIFSVFLFLCLSTCLCASEISFKGGNKSSSKIVGITDGSSANSGMIGEYISASIASGAPITLVTTEYADVCSVTVTAGDWDISCVVSFAGAVTSTQISGGIGTASGNDSAGLVEGDNFVQNSSAPNASSDSFVSIPSWRTNVTTNTVYYLKARSVIGAGTETAFGRISARRVR